MLQYFFVRKSLVYINTLSLLHPIKSTVVPLYPVLFQVYPIDLEKKNLLFKLTCSNQDSKGFTYILLLYLIHPPQSGELRLPLVLSHTVDLLKQQSQLSYRISNILVLANDFLVLTFKNSLLSP